MNNPQRNNLKLIGPCRNQMEFSITCLDMMIPTDTAAVTKWKEEIGSDEVNELYKKRCSTAEFSNAQVKNHGFIEFLVRGLEKVQSMSLLHAISNNLQRCFNLRKAKEDQAGKLQTA